MNSKLHHAMARASASRVAVAGRAFFQMNLVFYLQNIADSRILWIVVLAPVLIWAQAAPVAGSSQWKVTEKEMTLADFRSVHCDGSSASRLTGYTGIQRIQAAPVLGRFSKCLPEGIELREAFSAATPIPVKRTVIPWDAMEVVEFDEPTGRAQRKRTGLLVALGSVGAAVALGFKGGERAAPWVGLAGLAAGAGIAANKPEHRLRVRIQR